METQAALEASAAEGAGRGVSAQSDPDRHVEVPLLPDEPVVRRPDRTPWAWAVGTFFGAGFLKPGPGTWGSVAAMLLWLVFQWAVNPSPPALRAATLLAALLALVCGIPAASLVEQESPREDPGHVVIDEVAGQWIALLPFCGYLRSDLPHALLALGLFRLFDITKPPPARQLERLHGGVGIMLDDVAAGVYALIVGAIIGHWW
ncbi:phosphatidylglycerophosphatase A [Acidipila sp. EB88]|nr:phosphatidylglycerophosphatase A [Acidipila sp. EB88]